MGCKVLRLFLPHLMHSFLCFFSAAETGFVLPVEVDEALQALEKWLIQQLLQVFIICRAFSVGMITPMVFAVFNIRLLSAVVKVDNIFRGSSCT